MIGRTHRRFWKCFEALPAPVQKLAREKYIAASLILTRFFAVAETNVPDRRTRLSAASNRHRSKGYRRGLKSYATLNRKAAEA